MGVEEVYIVSFDISENGDIPMAAVMTKTTKSINGSSRTYEELKCVNRFVGEQAVNLYKKLTNKDVLKPCDYDDHTESGLLNE